MKRSAFFFSLILTASLHAEDNASVSVARLDASAAIALAETIPLLTVNLNNYKHPANPILTAGEKGEWDAAGIERVAVIRVGREDWRMWYACTGQRHSIGLATSKDGVHVDEASGQSGVGTDRAVGRRLSVAHERLAGERQVLPLLLGAGPRLPGSRKPASCRRRK